MKKILLVLILGFSLTGVAQENGPNEGAGGVHAEGMPSCATCGSVESLPGTRSRIDHPPYVTDKTTANRPKGNDEKTGEQ